jgi:hypothetical protein
MADAEPVGHFLGEAGDGFARDVLCADPRMYT